MNKPVLHAGTAGWSVPADLARRFPGEGTHLERYAARMNAVEINSSFYRTHRPSTYARWARSVPEGFRFAVKLPKAITHEAQLTDSKDAIAAFAVQVRGLGEKLGPILVQLPPSLAFPGGGTVERFFGELGEAVNAPVVCEPRHASWFSAEVDALLVSLEVARVAADPALHSAEGAGKPGGWNRLAYWRLHGSPRIYYSDYPAETLQRLHAAVGATPARQTWVIFDNTASGAALGNALDFAALG